MPAGSVSLAEVWAGWRRRVRWRLAVTTSSSSRGASGLEVRRQCSKRTASASIWGRTILPLYFRCLSRIFTEAGQRLDDYLELVRIDPQWRSFFADGTTLDLRADIDQMSVGLDAFAQGTSAGYRRFMEQSARLHHVSDRFFFWRPVGGLRDMFDLKTAFEPSLLLDVLALHPGADGGGDGAVACSRRACCADARSFHPVCGLGSRRIARGTLRHRPHADQ